MFNGFTSSQPLDLSGFNTALVESFSGIFSYSNMPSVNITNWQTSQYTLPSTTSSSYPWNNSTIGNIYCNSSSGSILGEACTSAP